MRYQCETGLEGVAAGGGSGRDDENEGMNEWGMLNRLVTSHMGIGQDSSSKGVRFEDTNNNGTNPTSVHPINQLSLRGEMDFWGYGK